MWERGIKKKINQHPKTPFTATLFVCRFVHEFLIYIVQVRTRQTNDGTYGIIGLACTMALSIWRVRWHHRSSVYNGIVSPARTNLINVNRKMCVKNDT